MPEGKPWEYYQNQERPSGGQPGPWNNYKEPETPAQESQKPTGGSNPAAALLNSLGQGLSFGFSDELAAGVAATVKAPLSDRTWKEIFAEQLQIERGNLKAGQEEFPKTSLAGEVGGAIGTGAGLVGRGATLAGRGAQTLPRVVGRGAIEGGLYGAAYGAGKGETADERVIGAAKGGALGAVSGAAVSGAGGIIGRQTPRAPSLDELRSASQAAYKASESIGLNINQSAFRRFVGSTEQLLKRAGYRENVSTGLRKVLREINIEVSNGGPISLSKMDELRKIALTALDSNKPNERRLIHMLIGQIDNFVEGLTPAQTTASGLPNAMKSMAIDALKDARLYWSRSAKGEAIQNAIDRAHTLAGKSGRSLDLTIRQELDAILRSPRRIRGFNQTERDALKKVVEGGPLDHVYRLLGRLDPTKSVFGGAMGMAVGGTAAGTPGAIGVPLIGAAAGRAASGSTLQSANLLSELVRRGAPTAVGVNPATIPLVAALASQPEAEENYLRQRGNRLVDLLMGK